HLPTRLGGYHQLLRIEIGDGDGAAEAGSYSAQLGQGNGEAHVDAAPHEAVDEIPGHRPQIAVPRDAERAAVLVEAGGVEVALLAGERHCVVAARLYIGKDTVADGQLVEARNADWAGLGWPTIVHHQE